jgi:Arc/MetJ family transcription regulator
MRTTLHIDDTLLTKAAQLTGIREKTSLVKRGLETLISVESSKRLAQLGASEKNLRDIRRRKAA